MHVGLVPFRLLRAGVFGVASVAVSALLHVVAGGHLHRGPETMAAIGALSALAFVVGRRQRGLPVIVVCCAVAQVLLHFLFNLPSFAVLAVHPGHLLPSPGMILVHLAAIAVTAVWLHRSETALAVFLDLLSAAFAALVLPLRLGAPRPRPRRAARPPWRDLPGPHSAALAAIHPLRGPPAFAAASL
ncbi:hypothetical protein GCM10027447_20800 [Glycomyces halotolerans]